MLPGAMLPGARVSLGRRRLGLTPVVIRRPCEQPWAVTLSYPGFEPAERLLDADYDALAMRVTLRPEGAAPGGL